MFVYQYILLLGFAGLYFNKNTRVAAIAFLVGWGVYLIGVIGVKFEHYFILSAIVELFIAYSLNNKYRYVSYISYLLIFVNIAGLILHINGVRSYYNDIYAILSISQFVLLLDRLVPDGICRLCIQRATLRYRNYDSSKTCAKMHKTTPADESHK